jgi:formamidopyrimidine-DNA glycosylase
VQPVDAPDEIHLRIRFTFDDGGPELRFVDQRTFGGMAFSAGGAQLPDELAHIARDPIDPLFSDEEFIEALRRKKTQVKRALLDQTLISGVGNIYADEALWRAKLHWARPTGGLTRAVARGLLGHVRDVLTEAIAQGGTSFDALYVNVNGESGYFDRVLAAYGQEGRDCRRCGAMIRREAFMNRSSFSCPKCQPTPRSAPVTTRRRVDGSAAVTPHTTPAGRRTDQARRGR